MIVAGVVKIAYRLANVMKIAYAGASLRMSSSVVIRPYTRTSVRLCGAPQLWRFYGGVLGF